MTSVFRSRLIWVWLLGSACSGGSDAVEDDDDGDNAGIGEGLESDADSSTDTDTDTDPCNPWYPCQDCGGQECSAELSACISSGSCQPALNTWAACVLDCGDTETCADQFVTRGGDPAAALADCVRAQCAEACDL